MMSMSMSVRNTYQIERRWIIMSRGRVGDKPFVRVVVSLEWCTCKRLIAPDIIVNVLIIVTIIVI